MRGLFVTGTDTGVGKTALAGSIVAALHARSEPVRPLKPIITGLDEPLDEAWPPDHVLLARAAGVDPDSVALERFGPAVSPHLAAELAGRPVDPTSLVAAIRGDGAAAEYAGASARASANPIAATVIVEGAGGLLVPITDEYSMLDLARELDLPLVIAARPGLGTINHTLLTLHVAKGAGLHVAAVVLTPWPSQPSVVQQSNRDTIAALGAVPVETLPPLANSGAEALAAAGTSLPIARWLRVN